MNGRNKHHPDLRTKLTAATDELIRLRDEIFGSWLTRDDLAEKLVEAFPLSDEQLKAAAERFPAPQVWYEQADAPFQPRAYSASPQ